MPRLTEKNKRGLQKIKELAEEAGPLPCSMFAVGATPKKRKKPIEPRKPNKPVEPKEYKVENKIYSGNCLSIEYETSCDYDCSTLDYAYLSITDYYTLESNIKRLTESVPGAKLLNINMRTGDIDYIVETKDPKYESNLSKYIKALEIYNKELADFTLAYKKYKEDLKAYKDISTLEELTKAKALVDKLEKSIK